MTDERAKIVRAITIAVTVLALIGGLFKYDDRLAKKADLLRIENEFNKVSNRLQLVLAINEISEIKTVIADLEDNFGGENVPHADGWLKDLYISSQIQLEFKMKELERIERGTR